MKKKAMLVVLLVVFVMGALSAGNAEAAFYTATISQVGASWTSYVVVLTSTTGAFPANSKFVIDKTGMGTGVSSAKEMYAAALTAFANSTNVVVYMNSPAGPTVYALYAAKP